MRGGQRFKFVPINVSSGGTGTDTVAQAPARWYARANTGAVGTAVSFGFNGAGGGLTAYGDTQEGATFTNLWNHPALEYEIPYLNRARFINPRKILPLYTDRQYNECGLVTITTPEQSTATSIPFEFWTAAADDFSLHHFMYVPEMRIST